MNAQTALHGLIGNMTNTEYHSATGISKSALDYVAKSPRHYWDKYINPDREKEEPTSAMIIGSAVHSAVIEPDLFSKEYVGMPADLDRRTKVGKLHYEELVESGKTVLSADDYQLCLTMRDAVHAHPVASDLFADGVAEQSYFAIDPDTGLLIKCRPDWMTANRLMIDLKTTDDASPSGFAKSVVNFRYYVQAAWYMDLLRNLYGEAPPFFVFVAVEKKRPHAIGVYFVDPDTMEIGRTAYKKDLRTIAACLESGVWRDYCKEIEQLQLPAWFKG